MADWKTLFAFVGMLIFNLAAEAQPFHLPTANHALFEKGGEAAFFVPTPGKDWETGCFGCVRTDRNQMHEGLDIKCLQRDAHGEPADTVMAAADGTVAYINDRPSLSNYGRYIVVQHVINGVEVYSLYAHLQSVRSDLKAGKTVQSGEPIAVMGRTTNSRETISKERAHVHFELNLFYSDRFQTWYNAHFPKEKNDHGIWNGENLAGIDSRLIFLAEHEEGPAFNLTAWLLHRTELCRVFVKKADLQFAKRYPMLVKNNPVAQKEGVAGFEMSVDYNGVPIELVPRAASEIKGAGKYRLLSVNEPENARNPCRKLVKKVGTRWELATNGTSLLDLLTE